MAENGKAKQGKAKRLGWGDSVPSCLSWALLASYRQLSLGQDHSVLSGTVLLTGTPGICLEAVERGTKGRGKKKNQQKNPEQRFCLEQRPQGKRGLPLPERPLTFKRNLSNAWPSDLDFQP